ncbi:Uncharacterised protein [Vibrio cholerae]|nr:Uncharacterised protein [Vibrio cholerae]
MSGKFSVYRHLPMPNKSIRYHHVFALLQPVFRLLLAPFMGLRQVFGAKMVLTLWINKIHVCFQMYSRQGLRQG